MYSSFGGKRLDKLKDKKRKEEEAEDYDDDEKIKIFRGGPSIKLDTLDIHDLSKEIRLAPDISNEIEVLTT